MKTGKVYKCLKFKGQDLFKPKDSVDNKSVQTGMEIRSFQR